MRVFIGLLTPDESLRRHYGAGKDGVVHKDSIMRGHFSNRNVLMTLGSYVPEGAPSPDGLERWILSRTRNSETCLLLIDPQWEHIAINARVASFSIILDLKLISSNYRNFFHKATSRLLRAFGPMAARFENSDDYELLGLPLRNFDGPELAEIARLCRDECLQPNFNNSVQEQLGLLHKRRRPRRRSKYNTVYTVDNRKRFFVYGKELHSHFGTGEPHKPFCELNGNFRFGKRIDTSRHYNVSETENDKTTIAGEFSDCHNAVHTVGSCTHLNMFSNDFF